MATFFQVVDPSAKKVHYRDQQPVTSLMMQALHIFLQNDHCTVFSVVAERKPQYEYIA